jgi:transposase-like protein
MPWKESRIVNERLKFVADVLKGERSMTELCRTYGIARKTGYKWVERYHVAGPASLEDLTHRPHRSPPGEAGGDRQSGARDAVQVSDLDEAAGAADACGVIK